MRTLSVILIAYCLSGCAGKTLPKMERPISLFNGCPTFEGICKLSKDQVKDKIVPMLPSIDPGVVSDWIEVNVDGVITKKVRVLPAKSKEFSQYLAIPKKDWGIVLKYIDDLKRKIVGNR
jgi:hypothetical protein